MDRLQQSAPDGSAVVPSTGTAAGLTIVTAVNSLSPTSMPLNEFVAWRSRHLPGERHRVVSLAGRSADAPPSGVPGTVPVVAAGGAGAFLREVRATLREGRAPGDRRILHAHHPRSGVVVALARLGAATGTPVLFTVHNMFTRYHPATRLLSAASFAGADHVTFVSHAAADAFPAVLKRARAGAFTVIPNGVDLERVDATLRRVRGERGDRPAEGRRFRLVNVGKFTEQKGHGFLLDVVKRLPEVDLVLVGDGPLRPGIRARVEREGLAERVRFTGLVAREQVYAELLDADLFVSPALWEGLPIAVLEAMALSTPVLLSDIAPHREIRREQADLPLLAADPGAWEAAIRDWSARTPDARAGAGAGNRRTVERAFTLARMHERYTEVYDALTSGRGGRR